MAEKICHCYPKNKKHLNMCYTKGAGGVKLFGTAETESAGDLDDRGSVNGYSSDLQKAEAAVS